MKRITTWAFFLGFFILVNCGLPSCQDQDHEMVFSDSGKLTADDHQLRSTFISPHLGQPIVSGQNVLWCGTFQLAWNQVAELIGEDPHFISEPSMVAELNRKTFTRDDLDAESYVALAGFVRDGIFDKIDRALAEKFKGRATPRFLPQKDLTGRPQDIVAYSYLFKNLEFAVPFEDLDTPLGFGGTEVASFGMREYKSGQWPMCRQVRIMDYKGPDDFVIELETKSNGDQLILARIAPAVTLAETISLARDRTKTESNEPMFPGDVLVVPKFNFDVTRQYRELLGLQLQPKNSNVAKDLSILSALQNIRFQMDEKGVRLRSESSIQIGCSAAAPAGHHFMIFDKPFLVLMQRSGRKTPYFAVWVDNAELMVKR